MGVKSEYKQTEVGAIPEDWEVKPIADIATTVASGRSSVDSEYGDFPVYGSTGTIGRSLKGDYEGRAILIARVGANAGTLNVVDGEYGVTDNTIIVRINDSVLWSYVWRQLDAKSLNSIVFGSGQPLITGTQIKNLLLPFPPTKAEQQAVAEVLCDGDALIKSLEQLIAKKRQIKQGAMQELLTGRKRLPGFSEEWQITEIGGIGDIRNGATPSTRISTFWNGSIPWCTPTDITVTPGKYLFKTERRITPEGLASCGALLLPAGALLLCSRATIGEIKIATLSVCTNQGFKSLVCKDGVSHEFMYYLLLTLKPEMLKRASGSTFLEISKNDLATIEVMLPTLREQNAIGTILSDMDAEITMLEDRLSKVRQLKQGMMQELLTGRIRLI